VDTSVAYEFCSPNANYMEILSDGRPQYRLVADRFRVARVDHAAPHAQNDFQGHAGGVEAERRERAEIRSDNLAQVFAPRIVLMICPLVLRHP
jgi:hypothetical protein